VTKYIVDYLDQLTFDYTQLCQRDNGSVYGIASGKQCRKGKPISTNPNIRQETKASFDRARSAGLSNTEIRKVWKDVSGGKPPTKETLEAFDKRVKDVSKSVGEAIKSKVELDSDPSTGFLVPRNSKNYDIDKDLPNLGDYSRQLGYGEMGAVSTKDGPPPGVIKGGHLGQYEAEALARLSGTGLAPELHGVKFTNQFPPRTKDPGFEGHIENAYGAIAMGKMEGDPLARKIKPNTSVEERDAVQSSLFRSRKALHQEGIAHNDMHGFNTFVKPDGSVGFIDFGLSQVGYRFALIEAMGSDWQFLRLHSQGPSSLRTDSPDFQKFVSNRSRAIDYMRNELGVDWGKNIRIRTSEESLKSTPLGNLSDSQIKKVIDLLYEGF